MKQDFILPDIGEGIVECEIVEWLVKEGELISEDQPVCDVMTDKALVQIPAVHNGVVSKLYYAKGDIAKVHAPLFEMHLTVDNSSSSNPVTVSDTVPQISSTVTEGTATIAKSTSVSRDITEDFILPDIGEGIVECEIVEWLVAEGDNIEEDQPVCDVMTDKALVQIPAKYAGVVSKLYYAKGDIAKVHAPLFAIRRQGDEQSPTATAQSAVTSQVVATSTAASNTATNTAANTNSSAANKAAANSAAAKGVKALASPAVRRLARELSIDIQLVPGSGDKGRVFKDDVHAFAKPSGSDHDLTPKVNDLTPKVTATSAATSSVAVANSTHRVEPIRGIKAAMARQMSDSVATIPHFTYCEEIDLTELIALRNQLKDQYAKQGVKLTMMPFFMKALSLAINEFPVMNSQPNADCTELTYFSAHNIGIAVDSKVGLLVPNVKGCEQKSIVEIANALTKLTEAAREGRVSPADLKGGTITISNIGAIGGTVATPIINKPEVAIVALGKVQALPRFDANAQVVARQIMQISWSGDHRIIDGGTIARFTNLWKQYLEQPSSMLVAMR
ncbi:dihydrolipoamide acetyltransferase component of pyruvate dehydrogenase complex [Alishewanella longhuensis]|uniref:Dihydrolipoamide acetyltransferase component of pyruvate dehydrogenase complex n=1 Tax=Alishewanella longhuensis TaxID=1091037 RepID=A0ABQ3L066_9ALTE|nr:dihydrolipoyllysine-residue acetyltransferase [Alishewanella longhuensis]GHG71300.1 dihydrolipoamide acetyltransferase component of pyruvate dehydrogenase complex [Alishewanella longhuensis]